MEKITCKSWEDFKCKVEELKELRKEYEKKAYWTVSPLLFRGQRDYKWKLKTTLQRTYSRPISLLKYYEIILSNKAEIEEKTANNWEIPSLQEYEEILNKEKVGLFEDRLFQGFEYIAYLRHHGFPSPLLDWTLSPDIAGLFAFQKATEEAKYVGIYAFLEFTGIGKMMTRWQPNILSLNDDGKNPRHSVQKSRYTICTHCKKEGAHGFFYANHEKVILKVNRNQDLLKKFIIPSSERIKVLKLLENKDINAFKMYGSEESLMETIALREFFLKG